VELSPDGANLYTTSFGGDALAQLDVGDGLGSTPADTASGGAQPAHAERRSFRVTVRIDRAKLLKGTARIVGSVRSAARRCQAGATVRLFRAVRGDDPLEASDNADRSGRFRLELAHRPSFGLRLYARVKARKLVGGDQCKAGRSPTFRVAAANDDG
jgi:hypothetical protein